MSKTITCEVEFDVGDKVWEIQWSKGKITEEQVSRIIYYGKGSAYGLTRTWSVEVQANQLFHSKEEAIDYLLDSIGKKESQDEYYYRYYQGFGFGKLDATLEKGKPGRFKMRRNLGNGEYDTRRASADKIFKKRKKFKKYLMDME